ncbi:MAG TPA: GNAT family N-acetyltransferase [Actinomycetota bacterium]|nr:GNAT family N-acetyltransferase [Actinomycetota bacterium]
MIETARLLLRLPEARDADAYLAIHSDPDVTRWLDDLPQSVEEELGRIERRRRLQEEHGFTMWAVEEKETGEMIGAAGLFHVEGKGPDVEVAYHFAKDRWGRGYATEAARACVAFGFENAGLDRIVGLVVPENVASARVLQKCGMTLEGPAHHYGFDLDRYALTSPRESRTAV